MDTTKAVIEAGSCALGFIAKELFCFTSVDAVRNSLQYAVNRVARSHFNFIAAALMSTQLSTMLTVSVTCFVGDIIYFTIKEGVYAIVQLVRSFFNSIPTEPAKPVFKEIALRTFQYAVYFFTRTLFCNSAVMYVRPCVDFSLRMIAHIGYEELSSSIIRATWALILTPPVTFVLGEVVGAIAGVAVLDLFNST